MTLKEIIRPISQSVFLYKAVKAGRLAHIPAKDPKIFDTLMNDDIIENYINKILHDERFDKLMSKKYSLEECLDGFIDGSSVGGFTSAKEYLDHVGKGNAAVVKDIGKFHDEGDELHELMRDIDYIFHSNYSLWCNVYISDNKTALAPHTDMDSIIILHFRGKRHWNFFGAVNDWKTGKPVSEIHLSEGDFLYFPKWAPHVVKKVPGEVGAFCTIEIPTPYDVNAQCPDGWSCLQRKVNYV